MVTQYRERHNTRWTEETDERLRLLIAEGALLPAIAHDRAHERTHVVVDDRRPRNREHAIQRAIEIGELREELRTARGQSPR